MKKWLLLACVMCLAFGAVSGAVAGPDDDWTVFLRPRTNTGQTGTIGAFGTKTGASDGIDSNDTAMPGIPSGEVFIACFDLGPQGYTKDTRAPLDWNQVKVWNLKLWLSESSSAAQIHLAGWSTGLNGVLPVRLEVVSPPGMVYQFNSADPGNATTPAFQWVFDGTMNRGFENAIDLRLIAGPVVPEPASAATLLFGLAGVVGWVSRRRW